MRAKRDASCSFDCKYKSELGLPKGKISISHSDRGLKQEFLLKNFAADQLISDNPKPFQP